MGVDFIYRAERSFRRQWDRGLSSLRTPDLFGRVPELRDRRFAAMPTNGARLEAGGEYNGMLAGSDVVVLQSNREIARVPALPLSMQNRIRNEGCGVVVVKVQAVQPISGAADVTLR